MDTITGRINKNRNPIDISLSYNKRFVMCDKETKEKAFGIKLLNGELSTMERMFEKFPLVNRCNEVKRWEVDNGIKNRQKKKIGPPMVINPITSIVSSDFKNRNKFRRDKRILKNIYFNVVKKYLFQFIQNNIKWIELYKIGCLAES
ncbi:hypothetical protein Glove_172g17 [Diversispora epigaea]|uniref:Uncharacterized protein n=1 Tax=Diversispora epigaea TaxID=1348612 RepID=A0A397IVJ7_9GLOM|nr:hypothetical protein Glove_172g17 [Diversispora epigaea]